LVFSCESTKRKMTFLEIQKQPLVYLYGRSVSQEVSRWLPTTADRVRIRAACGVYVDKEAMGQVFSEYFGFSCESFHQILHHHNHPGLAQ
jgi:hypothetical protein